MLLLIHPLTTECSGTVSSTLSTCHTRRVTLVIIPCPRVTPDVLLLLQYLVHVLHQTCYSCYSTLSTCHTRRVTLVTVPCRCVTPDVLLLLQIVSNLYVFSITTLLFNKFKCLREEVIERTSSVFVDIHKSIYSRTSLYFSSQTHR